MSILKRFLGKEEPEPEPKPEEPKKLKGNIIWLDRGWGFITSRDIEYTRIFFHWSGLVQDTLHFSKLKTGMKVEFEVRTHPKKGYKAVKIKVVV